MIAWPYSEACYCDCLLSLGQRIVDCHCIHLSEFGKKNKSASKNGNTKHPELQTVSQINKTQRKNLRVEVSVFHFHLTYCQVFLVDPGVRSVPRCSGVFRFCYMPPPPKKKKLAYAEVKYSACVTITGTHQRQQRVHVNLYQLADPSESYFY